MVDEPETKNRDTDQPDVEGHGITKKFGPEQTVQQHEDDNDEVEVEGHTIRGR